MQKIVTFCVAILGGLNLGFVSSDLSDDVLNLTEATSRFSHKLYKELTRDLPVAIYSPFSAHAALSKTYLGARGTTADQMKSVLQLSNLPQPHVAYQSLPHVAYKSLLRSFASLQDVEVYVNSAICVKGNVKIRESYMSDLVNYYNDSAEPNFPFIQSLDDKRNTEVRFAEFIEKNTSALQSDMVNYYDDTAQPFVEIVEVETRGDDKRITDVLESMEKNTSAILIHSFFFSGTWASQFDPDLTYRGSFKTKDGIVRQVDFMVNGDWFGVNTLSTADVEVVRLPFKNLGFFHLRFAFYIVLPRTIEDFAYLENLISSENFDDSVFFKDLTKVFVSIRMPKFNVMAILKLKNALNNLGMTAAFSKDADFSGISDDEIEITEVLQRTVLEVLETGTVPAANSSETTGITGVQKDPFFVEVDRPFIFYIRDDDSGLILLQGKMTDPTQNEVYN